jgi:hypothetical protein
MSYKIKYIQNRRIKLFIEFRCFIHVLFHSIRHCSLKNDAIKLSTKNDLMKLNIMPTKKICQCVVTLNENETPVKIPLRLLQSNLSMLLEH